MTDVLSDYRVRSAMKRQGWTDAEVLELSAQVPRRMVYQLICENIRLSDLPYVEDRFLAAMHHVGPTLVAQLRLAVPFDGHALRRVPCSHCGGTGFEPVTYS